MSTNETQMNLSSAGAEESGLDTAQSQLVQVRFDKLKNINILIKDATHGRLHAHSCLELGLVLEGKAQVCCQSGCFEAQPGSLILLNAYEPHEIRGLPSARLLYAQLTPGFGKTYFGRIASVDFKSGLLEELPELQQIRSALLNSAQAYFAEPEVYGLECAGWLSLLVTTLLRQVPYRLGTEAEFVIKKKKVGRTQRIASFVEQHYREKLSLTQLAQVEGVTTAYMSRIFSELFHVPFQEYLSQLRLQKAMPLLKNPNLYLVDICMECGFSDTRYLNAVCQKKFGCSAVAYRKMLLNREDVPQLTLPMPQPERTYDDEASLQILRAYMERYQH